jgi:hypothetical protein
MASDNLNSFQGIGVASRLSFDKEKLISHGWKLSNRESESGGRKRTIVSFVDPSGKKYKSGKDVERFLKENNLWDEVMGSDKDDEQDSSENEMSEDNFTEFKVAGPSDATDFNEE